MSGFRHTGRDDAASWNKRWRPTGSGKKPRMNVLHLFKTYFPETQGGLEETIRQLCRAVGEAEHRVFTLANDPTPPVIEYPECTVYRFRRDLNLAQTGFSLSAIRAYREHLRWADVVHVHFPWPFADLLHLTAPRRPTVVTYQSDVVRQAKLMPLYRPVLYRFLDRVDAIVATSPAYLETSEVLQRYKHKTRVIPNALDPATLAPAAPEVLAHWRERVGEGFHFFIGLLRYYKGLRFSIRAAAGAPFRVVIAGDGEEREPLKALIEEIGAHNVTMVGRIDDAAKVALLQLSRSVVLPSHVRSEAFGMMLLEGMLFEKPLVTCEIGTGTTYVNADGESGLVVPPADPAALRQALLRLETEPELARRLGEGARRRYERLFTTEKLGYAYREVYRDILKGVARAAALA